MIDDSKIAEALEAEVKESALPRDIWQGVVRKIAHHKSKKTRFRWPRSQLVASILIAIFLISFGGMAMALFKNSSRPDTVLNFEASLTGNEALIKGDAPLPDGTKIRLLAHREIVFEEKKQKETSEVLIALTDAKVSDEQFIATLVLDDTEWYSRKLVRDAEFGINQEIEISDNVKITALYIPEELQPSPDAEPRPRSSTTAQKSSPAEDQNKTQVFPRYGQIVVKYPFTEIRTE